MKQGKLLIVDDEIHLREMLKKGFETEGYEVVTVPDPDQALKQVKEHLFELMILDVNLGRHSGLSLLREIRKLRNRLPVVIFSGIVTSELEKEARIAGADEVLGKDLRLPVLLEKVRRIIGAARRNVFDAGASAQGKRILLVDDDPAILSLMKLFFERKGCEVLTAESGEKALRAAAEHKPQLALVDVNMPGMDGLETLKKLKEARPPGLGSSDDNGRPGQRENPPGHGTGRLQLYSKAF